MSAEAERIRRCRLLFERAIADGCSMDEARGRLGRQRWADAEARLAARRCGTRAPALPAPIEAERPEQWWQR